MSNMERRLLVPRYRLPDGSILESYGNYEGITCKKTGKVYGLDNIGDGYIRRSGDFSDTEDISLYTDSDHNLIRTVCYRGTRGKNGDEPYRRVLICNIDDEWLEEIIKYEEKLRPNNPWLSVYRKEKDYREYWVRWKNLQQESYLSRYCVKPSDIIGWPVFFYQDI